MVVHERSGDGDLRVVFRGDQGLLLVGGHYAGWFGAAERCEGIDERRVSPIILFVGGRALGEKLLHQFWFSIHDRFGESGTLPLLFEDGRRICGAALGRLGLGYGGRTRGHQGENDGNDFHGTRILRTEGGVIAAVGLEAQGQRRAGPASGLVLELVGGDPEVVHRNLDMGTAGGAKHLDAQERG